MHKKKYDLENNAVLILVRDNTIKIIENQLISSVIRKAKDLFRSYVMMKAIVSPC